MKEKNIYRNENNKKEIVNAKKKNNYKTRKSIKKEFIFVREKEQLQE